MYFYNGLIYLPDSDLKEKWFSKSFFELKVHVNKLINESFFSTLNL